MGKSARRSIHDDPSSPSSSPYYYYHPSTNQPESYQVWSPNDLTRAASTFGGAQSQIKNAENKTSSTAIPPTSPDGALPPSKPLSSDGPTQKPPTTTYKSFTTTYKSTASTRGYINYTKPSDRLTEQERLKMREEFFATYDLMTGIRIAATLGGFFFLMVFLVVYKSRSHSNKALRDPKIQARAAASVQEEEDREMQEAYEKTAFSLYQDELDIPPMDRDLHRDRIVSLGNVSCPPYLVNPNLRFSSIGGYSSLLEPTTRRYSDSGRNRRQSNSDSSRILSAYHLNDNYSNQNENFFNESDDCEEGDDEFDQRFTTTAEIAYPHGLLSVPRTGDSRRSSGMTCCSTESSFLERRCSAITLGLSSLSHGSSRRPSRDMWEMELGGYPGIQIIEATPKSSPCPSERQTHNSSVKDHIKMLDRFKRKRHDDNSIDSITEYPDENNHQYRSDPNELSENVVVNSNSNNTPQTLVSSDNISHQPVIRRAPLASLSSFKMSSIECQDSEEANGSVFDESCADTDDDISMEQFSTDSDEISLQSPPMSSQHHPKYDAARNERESSLDKNCDACVVIVNIDKNDDEILDEPNQLSNNNANDTMVFSSGDIMEPRENIERQRSNDKILTRPASCSGISSGASDKKSTSSDCVTVNVVEYKNDDEKPSLKPSSSVILEMPVLAKQNESSPKDSVTDPDVLMPGTSRKWSKETLF